jgi:hypothetical protein
MAEAAVSNRAPSSWRWPAVVAVGLVGLAGFGYLRAQDPALGGLYPSCLFHSLTGLYCPGCGTARALHALSHGRLLAALGLNPLAVLLLPALSYAGVVWLVEQLWARRLPRPVPGPTWAWALVAVIFAFWLLRNVPAWPFSVLAP